MNKINFTKILKVSLPIVIQNLILSLLSVIDLYMISGIGEKPLAAVTYANNINLFTFMLSFGTASGSGVFISQYYGAKNNEGIKKTILLNIIFLFLCNFIVFVFVNIFKYDIISSFSSDLSVIEMGVNYLEITSFVYIITIFSFPYIYGLRSIGLTKPVMYVTSLSIFVNTVLNYVLIYGKLGFNSYGVKGAAIATLISRFLEFIIIYALTYFKYSDISVSLISFKKISFNFVKKFFKVTTPVILNEGLFSLGVIFYLYVMSIYGDRVVVGYEASFQLFSLIDAIMIGFALSSQIMIGNAIGEGDYAFASNLAHYFIKIILYIAVFSSIIIFLSYNVYSSLFNFNQATVSILNKFTLILGVFMVPRFLAVLFVVGILRGGGDTKFAFFLDLLGMWIIVSPLIYVGVKYFNVDYIVAFCILHIGDVLTSILGYCRYRSKKWIHKVIEEI